MPHTFEQQVNERPSRSSAYQAQRQKNLRLAWILGSVALVFFLGFLAKMLALSS